MKAAPKGQLGLLVPTLPTAPTVPAIRDAVAEWRKGGYKRTTETTRRLLSHWFETDHRGPGGRSFRYHDSQRHAIETLIYLYEVASIRTHRKLLEAFSPNVPGLHILQHDDFARYCVKMATGSGKTKVMSLAIAWQYLNAVAHNRDDYATTFLVLAPNIIVFERLRLDFAAGRVFQADPIIPPELAIYWDFQSYLRGDPEGPHSAGALYLTNVQQFYDRPAAPEEAEEPAMTAVLGSVPPASLAVAHAFDDRIVARGGTCLVINDEAHHTHEETSEWNKIIRALHQRLDSGLAAQLDFTATPRYSKGGLFTWTVFDYPLKQAIIDGIVKRPMKGITTGIAEQPSGIASVRYRAFVTAGVERWREYRDQLGPLGKKPVLFVMMNETADADDVGEYLRTKYPAEFGEDRLLVIHTDRSGEVSKKDVDAARQLARNVDQLESPVNAIVSVLMLREGWDVQNVTVVLGLRPYSSKANILPEQTIGRGLRRMFRDVAADYVERLDVIGNKGFIGFVEQLEKDEDFQLESFVLKEPLRIATVFPDDAKMAMDIALPTLSPILARKKSLAEEISALDVRKLTAPVFPIKPGDAAAQRFHYEGFDFLTLEREVERDYTIPEPQTAQEVISYYAKRIAEDLKLPTQFAALAPKVREFLETKAFGKAVNIDTPELIKAISSNVAQYVTIKTFVQVLRSSVIENLQPTLLNAGRQLSETQPFPFSRTLLTAKKTVFNWVAVENDFESRFAKFLESAPDVVRFAKLPSQFGFAIEYVDSSGSLRYYEPDFVVVVTGGSHVLAETKGREDPDVAFKDRAAAIWCENASLLTATAWSYLKVPQKEFEKLNPSDFSDLAAFAPPVLIN